MLPAFEYLLTLPVVPRGTGRAIADLGAPATVLAGGVVARMKAARPGDDAIGELLPAVTGLAAHTAMDASVPTVVAGLLGSSTGYERRRAIAAAAALGPAGRAALATLRQLGSAADADTAVEAAGACCRIDPSTTASMVPVLTSHLAGPARRDALQELAVLGAGAATATAHVAELLRADHFWTRVDAAPAYWAISADATPAVPVLAAAWHDDPDSRRATARAAATWAPRRQR